MFSQLLEAQQFSFHQKEKESLILPGLIELTQSHYERCPPYQRIINGLWGGIEKYECLEDLPYLPVALFKSQFLSSVSDEDICLTLTSSGTTGQSVSRIPVDKETSSRQQKALAKSLAHVLGAKRLPMLIIDTDEVLRDPRMMSARGAGVLGLMRYGRDHTFSLTEKLEPDIEAVVNFLERVDGQPFFIFGFTFMVWLNFFEKFQDSGLDLSNGILIHSGGWKKMIERAVDNSVFRQQLGEVFGLTRIYNFYGMVEQIGSIFLEGEDGYLYPPNFSDIIIRDPETWQACVPGQPGVVQVVSLVPTSYPGHSLLTEDRGVIENIDAGAGGRLGKAVRILGRVSKAELRGCSDVIAETAA